MSPPEPKICAVCGRAIEWRAKWARDWDQVRYCSKACRKARLGPIDEALEEGIRTLLAARGSGKTICPSEVARTVAEAEGHEDWRGWMERTRQAARRLVAAGELEITQKGHVVDPSTARGAIRLRSRRSG
ncbi:MAG: DUF2256 and DUF3253 domain-containing protein [Myxococcota bacterium]